MNKQDIDNLIRWAVDTDGDKFDEEIYQPTKRVFYKEYVTEKLRLMHTIIIRWMAELDRTRRQNLVDAINNNPTNESIWEK